MRRPRIPVYSDVVGRAGLSQPAARAFRRTRKLSERAVHGAYARANLPRRSPPAPWPALGKCLRPGSTLAR